MQDNSDTNDLRIGARLPGHIWFPKSETRQSIPERFNYVAKTHPERTAIIDFGHAFSYRKLNEASNQIAHVILETRGDHEEPIALLLDQGVAPIIAILGILKAGKIYVALDPFFPRSDLIRTIADCKPAMLLTNEKYLPLAGDLSFTAARCLNMDGISENTCKDNPKVDLGPTNSAYIFYTSGSTGTPKGVVDCHGNVLHNIMRYTNNLGIVANDRLSLVQSCSFSGTVSSLFSALLNGATLCPFDLRSNGIGRLADWIDREQITILHSVPIIFEQLISTQKRFESLRIIRLEGDQAFRRHVELFKNNFTKGCVLVNGLGTTETGIVRQYFVDSDTELRSDVVPVGYAIEDMQIRLLDEAGFPVAQGVVGEITVQSPYLAKGYWSRSDDTAQAFRQSLEDADSRVYATGDMGRLLSDGCLEYVGRKDSRVKLRGQTIDLVQIENALCDLNTVTRAIVVPLDNGDGNQKLVAYLVAAGTPLPTVSTIRTDLAKSLPEIMLPARYVFLDELPVDRHNKVLRRTLPRLSRERPTLDQVYLPPGTPRQQAITKCFGEILGIDKVGLNDDFLELGGDSLMATNLMLLIQIKLDIDCPAEFFFQERTPAAIDRIVETGGRGNIIVPMQPRGTQPPLFCIHNHAGHVLEYRQLVQLINADQPVFGVQSMDVENYDAFQLEDIARMYVHELQAIQPNGPYNLCGNCFGGLVALEIAQQLRRKGEEVATLALIDTAYPAGIIARLNRRLGISRNWRELSQLPIGERTLSLGGKFARLFWSYSRKIWQCIHFGMANRSIESNPHLHRGSSALIELHQQMEKRYRPLPYEGKIALICIDVKENQLGWTKIVGQSLDVVRVAYQKGQDSHPHLIYEPYVQSLANELINLLDKRSQSN